MFDSFRNTAVTIAGSVALLLATFFGGQASVHKPAPPPISTQALAPVFDALGWCNKSPRPTVTVDAITSPNGDRTMHAIRGSEEIKFVQTINYAQTGAIFSHQIIPPGQRASVEVHDTVDFFPDAQRACFGIK